MSFDAVKVFRDTKRQFENKRGWTAPNLSLTRTTSSGQSLPLLSASDRIPMTTYADAQHFFEKFMASTREFDNWKQEDQFLYVPQNRLDYDNWHYWTPAIRTPGMQNSTDIYPYNQQFWGFGHRYALMRSSLGAVPGYWEMWVESVRESLIELVDRFPPVPRTDIPIGQIVKWSVAAGLVYLGIRIYESTQER